MAVIREAKVIEILTSAAQQPRTSLISAISSAMGQYPPRVASARYNQASAIALYNQLRTFVSERGYFSSKTLRPWEFDEQVLGNLDRSEPWWGWEFEMGFDSVYQRSEVIDHVWDNWDGVTFDAEGEGSAASEITFVPSERSKYYDGTAPALQFLQYISENKLGQSTGGAMIGTHINFSLPEMQEDSLITQKVASGLQASVAFLPQEAPDGTNIRLAMFGRSQLYSGFVNHQSYIEGKLFRTTYSAERFAEYIRVADIITRSAQAISDALGQIAIHTPLDSMVGRVAHGARPGVVLVTNMWEMYTGQATEPEVRWIQARSSYETGGRLHFDVNYGFTVNNRRQILGYGGGSGYYDDPPLATIHNEVLQYVDEMPIPTLTQQAA